MARRRWRPSLAWLALLPTLAIYAWVRLYPIGDILYLSLHEWNLIARVKPFIGFENFIELFADPQFHEALGNTACIAFGVLVLTIPTAMVLAALIHSRAASWLSGTYETAIFLPHIVSLVPAAMAWKWIFDARLGPLNAALSLFGVAPLSWLFDPALSVLCVVVLVAWQVLGYAVLIFLVGIKNLPISTYEAARLDGATPVQSFRHITVPMLRPITLYVSVVTLVAGFNVYGQAFVLASDAQGAPGRLVRVLVLDMLENGFRNYRVGYAAAEAVVLLVVVLLLTALQFGLLRDRAAGR